MILSSWRFKFSSFLASHFYLIYDCISYAKGKKNYYDDKKENVFHKKLSGKKKKYCKKNNKKKIYLLLNLYHKREILMTLIVIYLYNIYEISYIFNIFSFVVNIMFGLPQSVSFVITRHKIIWSNDTYCKNELCLLKCHNLNLKHYFFDQQLWKWQKSVNVAWNCAHLIFKHYKTCNFRLWIK